MHIDKSPTLPQSDRGKRSKLAGRCDCADTRARAMPRGYPRALAALTTHAGALRGSAVRPTGQARTGGRCQSDPREGRQREYKTSAPRKHARDRALSSRSARIHQALKYREPLSQKELLRGEPPVGHAIPVNTRIADDRVQGSRGAVMPPASADFLLQVECAVRFAAGNVLPKILLLPRRETIVKALWVR
eukprot:8751928-Pyramimonas_sp.AAC.1